MDDDNKVYESTIFGQFSGDKKCKTYKRLNCPSALKFIEKGQYVKYRVFLRRRNSNCSRSSLMCPIYKKRV